LETGSERIITLTLPIAKFEVPPPKKSAGGFQQAGKKGGGWGEGIFARLLPFPFRLSKRKAEGGFGGNSAFLLLKSK